MTGGSFLRTLHQGDKEGVIQGGNGQTDRTVAHDLHGGVGRLSRSCFLCGRIVVGIHIGRGHQSDLHGNGFGDGHTVDQIHGILHSGLTDQGRLLGNGAVHTAFPDGGDGIVGGIEAHHNDILACAGNGLHGTQCHFVIGSEDTLDIAVGLEHILHDGHTLGTVEVGGLLGHHLQLGIGNVMEALAAVNGGGGTGNALQLGHLGTLAQGIHDVLGRQLGTQNVVGSDLAVDLNTVDGTVHGDHTNALGLGSLHGTGNGIGIHGVHDQHADALGHQVLDIGNLLGHIVTGIHHGQGNSQIGSGLLGTLHQGHEEGVVLGGDGQANGTGGIGLTGLYIFLTVDDDPAAGEDKGHGDAKQHRDQFLNILHCNSSLSLSAFCRTELPPG